MKLPKWSRPFLIATNAFNSIAGFVCGLLFLIAPDGRLMGAGDGGLLAMMQNFPFADTFFRDFRWTGIAMLLMLAIPGTAATVALIRRIEPQYLVAYAASRLLFLFCLIELLFLPNPLVIVFMIIAIIQTIIIMRIVKANKTRAKESEIIS